MLKIRLQRVGRKNDASFRVIVTESTRGPKAGNALEILGSYDPKKNVSEIKKDRVEHWISVGAQVSDTVHNILVGKKIIKGDKINVLPKKSPIEKENASGDEKKKDETAVKEEQSATPETKKEEPKEDVEKEKEVKETETPDEAAKEDSDPVAQKEVKETKESTEKKKVDESK